ncbi:hypothetical protein K1X76_08655 [bacterium]|nr:hypothetical protein [bacterium]
MTEVNKKQQIANQQNALKGGVKSEEGKATVRFNARKHGILANLVADYEDNVFKNYVDALFEELKPESCIEEIIIERIALHYLKLYRLNKAESHYIHHGMTESKKKGWSPLIRIGHIEECEKIFERYCTTVENRLYRAFKELRQCREPLPVTEN